MLDLTILLTLIGSVSTYLRSRGEDKGADFLDEAAAIAQATGDFAEAQKALAERIRAATGDLTQEQLAADVSRRHEINALIQAAVASSDE
jgi:hypothetical protein